MTTQEFIGALREAADKALVFIGPSGHRIHSGYHLTEIKAADLATVDCGGQVNRWPETIIQLWVPAEADSDYMLAGKFVSIWDKVQARVPLKAEAEIRVEYGDENIFPSTYHVRSVSQENGTLRVQLEPPAMTCKARDRRAKSGAETCCA